MSLTFDPITTAELSACTTKKQWCDVLIAAIGTTRTLVCKHEASGDHPWTDGTIFHQAALSGVMVVSSGGVVSLGTIAATTTSLAADMATGESVLRITGSSGRWVQGTLGLSGTDFTLTASPSANARIAFTTVCRVRAPAALPIGPEPTPVGGNTIGTLVLRNNTGSTDASGQVSKMFGFLFKEGDLPAGQYPQFLTSGGALCPATTWGEARWPDGSMRHCGAMIRVPVSVPSAGSVTITVRGGGAQPPVSALSAVEIAAATDIKVRCQGRAGWAEVDWVSSLNTALSNNILTDVAIVGSGHAGIVLRVFEPFKSSAGTHAQAGVWHYVAAVQNAAGDLAEIRYIGRFSNGWHDQTGSTIDVLAASNVVLLNGASTVRNIESTYGALTFSWSSSVLSAASAPTWRNLQPVRVTSTGTVPTGLISGATYFMRLGSGGTFTLHPTTIAAANNTGAIAVTGPGTGTHTVTPMFVLETYASGPYTAGVSGEWDSVIGTMPRSEVVIDRVYATSTKVLGPRRLDVPADALPDRDYMHDRLQDVVSWEDTTGERPDIGILTGWCFRHWINTNGLKTLRAYGLQQTTKTWSVRRAATRAPIAISGTNYPGMGTSMHTYQYRPSNTNANSGDVNNATFAGRLWHANDWAHRPHFQAYLYLITGEPQYLDVLHDTMNAGMATIGQKSPSVDGNNFRSIVLRDGQQRVEAWVLREIAWSAMLTPDVYLGSAIGQYAKGIIASNFTYLKAEKATASNFSKANKFYPSINPSPGQWQMSYLGTAMLVAYTATGNSDALDAVNDMVSCWGAMRSGIGLYNLDAYFHDYIGGPKTLASWNDVLSRSNLGALMVDLADNRLSAVSGSRSASSGQFTEGASIFLDGGAPPPLALQTRYYMRDVVGDTFRVSSTVGGPAIDITAFGDNGFGGTLGNPAVPENPIGSSTTSASLPNASQIQFQTGAASKSYSAMIVAVTRWLKAVGGTAPAEFDAAIENAYGSGPTNFANDPVYAVRSTF